MAAPSIIPAAPGAALALAGSLWLTSAGTLPAQSEAALKDYFEGKTVTIKIDMPATESGIDVYPGSSTPIDFSKYAKRIKESGTAIHSGDQVLVTKLKVKDKLIEFQLGGGGYGTFWDNTSSSVPIHSAEKTTREKNLERDVKAEPDPTRRRAMQEELDGLKKDREREDARNRAAVADAEEKRRENIREQALSSGSRFNLRYNNRVPGDAVYPEAIIAALADYVDFSPAAPAAAGPAAPAATLHKGLTRAEADALLGPPQSSAEGTEGSLHTLTATYHSTMGRVEALFVEGILIRYSVASD